MYNINKVMFCESNLIPVKAVMYIAGLIDTLEYRLPLASHLKKTNKNRNTMKQYDIKGFYHSFKGKRCVTSGATR